MRFGGLLSNCLRATVRSGARSLRLAAASAVVLCFAPSTAMTQWSTSYQLSPLRAPYNGELREQFTEAYRLFNAVDYADALRYEVLWGSSRARTAALETEAFGRLTGDLFIDPPHLPIAAAAVQREFAKLVPEAAAMLGWVQTLRRQTYDVLADESAAENDRYGRITELVAYYQSVPDLAISTSAKSLDALDAQFYSLAFRRAYPRYNGLLWATRWLEAGLYEPLVVGETPSDRRRLADSTMARFRRMLDNPPETTPYLLPMAPAIAPTFARRYPELATVLDNAHMLQDVIADILVAREVPRSAKRQEILRALTLFRSDTAFATTYDGWIAMGTTLGAENMGGPAVGFGETLPQPTVARGASVAGMIPRRAATAAADAGMAGMEHGQMAQGQDTAAMQEVGMETMMAVYQRMMADPVIRERIATDPVIRRLLGDSSAVGAAQSAGGAAMPGMNMPGMDHANMPGMTPPAGANAAPMTEERRRAIEFAVRLLSDPAVEARIHSDPELHRLWSDPDVQRRLAELRRARTTTPAPTRTQPPPPRHRHP